MKKNSVVTVLTDDKKYSGYIASQFEKLGESLVKEKEKEEGEKKRVKTLERVAVEAADQYEHQSFFDELWQQRGRTDRCFCSFKKIKK